MVNTLKKLSMVAALGMAFVGTAQASTFTIGSSFDGDIFVAPSSFVKTYTFDLSQAGTINYSVTEIANSFFNIDYLSFGLYNSNKDLVSGVLSSGIYTLRVAGDSVGPAGGLFNLNLSVAAAVPEPETNAMMMLGLAAIGLVAYRKKNMA